MLMEQPIPSYVGQGSPIANVGDMENWGLEFEAGWKKTFGDLKLGVSANASYLQNKLIKLGNASGEQIYENAGASGVGSYVKGKNGEVFPYFYGFKTDGIFQTQAEVDGYVNANGEKYQSTAKAGDVRFVDLNGERQTFTYKVRAASRGRFALPAASAEAMYNPALNARTGGGNVAVE